MKSFSYISCFILGCIVSGFATWKAFETIQLDANLITATTNLSAAITNHELLEEERYDDMKSFSSYIAMYEFGQIEQSKQDAYFESTKKEVNKWLSKKAEYETKLKPLNQ